jgi:hypothetical protein
VNFGSRSSLHPTIVYGDQYAATDISSRTLLYSVLHTSMPDQGYSSLAGPIIVCHNNHPVYCDHTGCQPSAAMLQWPATMTRIMMHQIPQRTTALLLTFRATGQNGALATARLTKSLQGILCQCLRCAPGRLDRQERTPESRFHTPNFAW